LQAAHQLSVRNTQNEKRAMIWRKCDSAAQFIGENDRRDMCAAMAQSDRHSTNSARLSMWH
jgi:hypothetical protein